MKLVTHFTLSIALVTIGCSKPVGDSSSSGNIPIRKFIEKLELIEAGYKYDLVSQDDKDCYKTIEDDLLFFPGHTSIIGYLSDTSTSYKVLYLESGDDLYPFLRVFSKRGERVDSKSIAYGNCAVGDCEMDSCHSYVKVIDGSSIERLLEMKKTSCDSLGNKLNVESVLVNKKQRIKVDLNGKITFSEAIVN